MSCWRMSHQALWITATRFIKNAARRQVASDCYARCLRSNANKRQSRKSLFVCIPDLFHGPIVRRRLKVPVIGLDDFVTIRKGAFITEIQICAPARLRIFIFSQAHQGLVLMLLDRRTCRIPTGGNLLVNLVHLLLHLATIPVDRTVDLADLALGQTHLICTGRIMGHSVCMPFAAYAERITDRRQQGPEFFHLMLMLEPAAI